MSNRTTSAIAQNQHQQHPPVLLFSERYSQPCRDVMALLKLNPPARGTLRCSCIDGQVDMVPPSVTGVPALYLPDTGTVLTGDMMMATLVRIVDGGTGGKGDPRRQQQLDQHKKPPQRGAQGAQRNPPPQRPSQEPDEFPYETGDGYEYVGLKDSGGGVLVFDEEDHGLQFFASADGSGPVPPGAAYPRPEEDPGSGARAAGAPPGVAAPIDSGKNRKLPDNTLEMILQERSREIQGDGQGHPPGHAPGGAHMASGPARFSDSPGFAHPPDQGGAPYAFR